MTGMKIEITVIFALLIFMASSACASIANTKHDLSFSSTAWDSVSYTYATTERQICIFCHTPHGGTLTGPLWNRNVPGSGGFTMYNSTSAFKVELNSTTTVNDESLLCLSCHDGSIAVNNLLNTGLGGAPIVLGTPPGTPVPITGSPGSNPRIGASSSDPGASGHLENDHPVSLNYSNALSDYVNASRTPELRPLAFAKAQGIKFFPAGGAEENIERSSCHDVHDNTFVPFLIKSNSGSDICLSCHIK